MGFVFGPCFVVQYLVSFLILQSQRELVALLLLPFDAMLLLVFCVSSSRCSGLVCSV